MAGPAAARRRAAQRTRNQVSGSLVAGVVIVAIGFFGGVLPALPTDNPIAHTTTEPPSRTTPDDSRRGGDLRAALMTADDIGNEAGLAWAESAEQLPAGECVPAVEEVEVEDQARIDFTAPEDNGVSQHLLRAETTAVAEDLFAKIRDQVQSCLPENQGDLPWTFNIGELAEVGEQGWVASYWTDPEDLDAPTPTVALVRYDNVLSVTVRTEPTSANDGAVDVETPARAAERMCVTLFEADCVGEAQFVDGMGGTDDSGSDEPGSGDDTEQPGGPVTDVLDLADDPFLTDNDVNPIGTYKGFTRAGDYTEDDPYTYRCLNDLDDVGADTVVRAAWFQELGEGSVAEFVLRMPDSDSAFRIISTHTILPRQCGDIPDSHEQTVSEPSVVDVDDADEALAWTIEQRALPEDPGSDPGFTGVGMARRANVVVVISFGAFDDPTDGDWSGYAAHTLAQALDRAIR